MVTFKEYLNELDTEKNGQPRFHYTTGNVKSTIIIERDREPPAKAEVDDRFCSRIDGFLKGISVATYLVRTRYSTKPPYRTSASHIAGVYDTHGKNPKTQWLIRLDKPHRGHHEYPHINVNPKLTGYADKHTPVPGILLPIGFVIRELFRNFLKLAFTVAVLHDMYRMICAMKHDLQNDAKIFSRRSKQTGAIIAATWAFCLSGASIGSVVGRYMVGHTFGVLVGVVPAAAVGSLLGKLAGGVAAGFLASRVRTTNVH